MALVTGSIFHANIETTIAKALDVMGTRIIAQRTINGESRGYVRDWLDASINRVYFDRAIISALATTQWDFGAGTLPDVWGDLEAWTAIDHLIVVHHTLEPLGGETPQGGASAVTVNVSGTLGDAMLGVTTGPGPSLVADRGVLAVSSLHTIGGGLDTLDVTNAHATLDAYVDVLALGRGA